jgi:hypothetical protein
VLIRRFVLDRVQSLLLGNHRGRSSVEMHGKREPPPAGCRQVVA